MPNLVHVNARCHTVSKLDVHIGMFFPGKRNRKYIGVLINVMTLREVLLLI